MNETHRVLVTVLVSMASAAVGCALFAPSPPAMPPNGDVDWTRLDRLAARVERLEASAAVRAEIPAPAAPEHVAVERNEPSPDASKLLDAIGARLRRLEENAANVPERVREPAPEPAADRPRDKEEASQWIVDPRADVAKKMRAHEAIRSVPDAYTPGMVAELVRIGTTDPSGAVRADVWRFFDGKTRLPGIVASLVAALQTDQDARAREEAADTLGSYLDDPIVKPALEAAVAGDAAQRVRDKATRTLSSQRSFAPVARAGGR